MIDLTVLMTDPDFTRAFQVKRRSGAWVNGRFTESPPTTFNLENPLMPSTAKEISLLPEGDRSSEAITLYTTVELFITKVEATEGFSDLIIFNNRNYKVVSCLPWDKYGYYKCMAVYIGGV